MLSNACFRKDFLQGRALTGQAQAISTKPMNVEVVRDSNIDSSFKPNDRVVVWAFTEKLVPLTRT
jgi:hypothetical protein